jgi:hypothetical protein
MVGRSGKAGLRRGPVTARARRRPSRTRGAEEVPEKTAAVSPATVAVTAGVPPRKGTWRRVIPARRVSISIASWCWEPAPPEA